jgi:acetyltransferase
MPQSAQNPKMLSPDSVAIIGASRSPEKIGSQIMDNVVKGGYKGKLYPINPKAEMIQNIQSYSSVMDVKDNIDVAIIATPAQTVPKILLECAQKNIQTVVIISAGFKESGKEGKDLENKIISIARENNIRIIGPNCLGFVNTDINLNATFSAAPIQEGNIILFSQSGALATAILDWANQSNLGFKHFVSLGNKANTNENHLLEYWSNTDLPSDTVLAGYLEDFKDGRRFMELASKISKKYPIIILHPGKTESAHKAISSHTGSIATDNSIIDSALRQSGCVRVDTLEEFTNTITIISRQSLPRGNNVLVVTNAGGPGVLTTDLIAQSPLEMAKLSESTKSALKSNLPPAASLSNPVDILGDGDAKRYDVSLQAGLADKNTDSAIVILTPQTSTEIEKTAEIIAKKRADFPNKPILASFIGGTLVESAHKTLNKNEIPVFKYPGDTVKALTWTYLALKAKEVPEFMDKYQKKDSQSQQKVNIVGAQAEDMAAKYGIPIAKSISIPPHQDTVPDIGTEIGFPVVAKLISPKLLHKTEVSGVFTNIKNQQEVIETINKLRAAWAQVFPGDLDYSVQIQKQVVGGEQVIMGMKNDPSFGPVILFGSGGTLAELQKDTAQRIAPATKEQLSDMIKETKIYQVISGYRGSKSRDIETIVTTLLNLQIMATENPDIQEIDVNPFIVLDQGQGGFAVDVKIVSS